MDTKLIYKNDSKISLPKLHLAVRFQLERALCTCIPVMTRARLMVDSYFTFFPDRIAKETFNHIETHHSLF